MWGEPEHVLVCYKSSCMPIEVQVTYSHTIDTIVTLELVTLTHAGRGRYVYNCKMHTCFKLSISQISSPWLSLKHTSNLHAITPCMYICMWCMGVRGHTTCLFIVMGDGIHCIVLVCVLAFILPFNFSSFIDASLLTTSLVALPSSVISSVA